MSVYKYNVVIWWAFCMHECSCQFMSKHIHIMAIITDYKSGDFFLKMHHIVTQTNQNIIMHQLKPLKQYMCYRYQQLDGMKCKNDNDNVFSITLPSLWSNKNHLDPMRNFVFQYKPVCHLKCHCHFISFIPSNCWFL